MKPSSRKKLRNSRVLLVAGDGLVKDLLFRFIKDKGAGVSPAATAVEGLKLFRKQDFDIVVVETGVPGLNRIRFLSCIRKDNPETAVVLIGARLDHGASDPPAIRADALIGFPLDMDRLSSLLCDAVAARRKKR